MVLAEDVVRAADALHPLGGRADGDPAWSVRVEPNDWTAARTLEHLADGLVFYAGQVARRARTSLPVLRDGRQAAPAVHLDNVMTGAHLLAGQLRDLGSERAWHPSGLADAAGWAGMAVTELLVHGTDAAHLLGTELDLPNDLCQRVMERVFPWVDTSLGEPSQLLLAVTGRTRVQGVAHDPDWWWQSAPLNEWDGQPRRRDKPPLWS